MSSRIGGVVSNVKQISAGLRITARSVKQATSLLLLVALITVSVPPVIARSSAQEAITRSTEIAGNAKGKFISWLKSAGFRREREGTQGNGQNPGMPAEPARSASDTRQAPQTKAERESKVSKLELNTRRDVQLQIGQRMLLSAVPLDINGNAIHGLAAQWESSNPQVVSITDRGEAEARLAGIAQITASAGTKKAGEKIIVSAALPNTTAKARENENEAEPSRTTKNPGDVGTSHVLTRSESKPPLGRYRENSHRAGSTRASMPQGTGRDPGSLYTANNAVGTPPGKTTPGAKMPAAATQGTETPGSSNFSFSVPVVSLAGRGLDIDLSGFYNARLWNRVDMFGTRMNYDVDQGWPSPGFRLGYGKVVKGCNSCRSFELVDPDGTRHQMLDPNVSPQPPSYNYDSADGALIHLTTNANTPPISATYPDGTQVLYGAPDVYAPFSVSWYPTQITDRNGNIVQISYVNGTGPKISSIQDTLGRYVRFYYAANNDLIA